MDHWRELLGDVWLLFLVSQFSLDFIILEEIASNCLGKRWLKHGLLRAICLWVIVTSFFHFFIYLICLLLYYYWSVGILIIDATSIGPLRIWSLGPHFSLCSVWISLAARVKPSLNTFFDFLQLLNWIVHKVHLFDKASFFESGSHSHSFFSAPWDNLLVEVAMGLFELVFVKIIDSLYVPKAFPDVADAARKRCKIKLGSDYRLFCCIRHLLFLAVLAVLVFFLAH